MNNNPLQSSCEEIFDHLWDSDEHDKQKKTNTLIMSDAWQMIWLSLLWFSAFKSYVQMNNQGSECECGW